jgi:putative ABC transport system permease protein
MKGIPMIAFFKVALSNVLRNTRRSFLVCLIIAVGLMFMFTIRGILNGLQKEIVLGITQSESGDIQITKKGYRTALPTKSQDFFFAMDSLLLREVAAVPGVAAITGRLTMGGLINHQASQTTTPFVAVAVDPDHETDVCPRVKDLIKEGSFIEPGKEKNAVLAADFRNDPIEEASVNDDGTATHARDLRMSVGEFHQVVIGRSMREGFVNAKIPSRPLAAMNDELILLTQDLSGSQRSVRATLTGIADARNPMANKSIVYLALPTAQRMLDAEGKITQMVVRLKPSADRFDVAKRLNPLIDGKGLIAEPWDEFNSFFVTIMLFQNAIFSVITAILVFIVMVAIMITAFMTVSERIREIGTLMAIGYRRHHILNIFLLESSLLGIAGGATGALMGLAVMFILGWTGIPFVIPGTGVPFLIRPWVPPYFVFLTVLLGMLSAVGATLYPARHASAMTPLKALGHI